MKYIKQRSIYFLYYFVFVTISFFNSPYLINEGIDMQVVGYAFSTSLLLSMLFMVLLGILNDNEIVSHKNSMLIGIIITIVSSLVMVLVDIESIKIIAFMITSSIFCSLPGVMDGLVLDSTEPKDYGKIRSFGSFGAAISYFMSSVILGKLAYTLIVGINTIVLIATFVFIYTISYAYKKSQITYKEALKITFENRNVAMIIIITLFTYGVLKADDAFNYNFSTQFAGYTALIYGTVGFFSIVFEASLMNMYNIARKKVSDKDMLYIAASVLVIIFLTKALLYKYTWMIIATDLALGVFVGLFVPTAIAIINNNSDEKVRTSILSIYEGAVLLGGVIFGYITTFFIGIIGEANLPRIYLLHATIIVISFIFITKINSKKQQ